MSSNKLTPENKTPLTEAQEESLLLQFVPTNEATGPFNDADLLEFARLYHTEATKQTPKSEGVKSAEEILKKHTRLSTWGGANGDIVDAMQEYAAQFQQGWRPIEEAPHGKWILVASAFGHVMQACWCKHGDSGYWIAFNDMRVLEVTHWQPLPSPPNEQL